MTSLTENNVNFKTTIVIAPIVLAACALFDTPVTDVTLDPETVLLRETEPLVYGLIEVRPEEWQILSEETREAIFDHNCVFATRNPDAVPGFDPVDCERED